MKTVTIRRTNELPFTARTYINTFSAEFMEKDEWTKLAHIAHLLKQGVDVIHDFRKDIARHAMNPQYGGYEDTAKMAIGQYISLLRSGKKNDLSWLILTEKMSFTALFRLLSEEILYRYWEECDADDSSVVCHFDEAFYNYDEIVVLSLNPGYLESVNKDYALTLQGGRKESVMHLLRNALAFNNSAIYSAYTESRCMDAHYWETSLNKLALRDVLLQKGITVSRSVSRRIT